MDKTFDFVIIGAGSAGCVLANRLSSNPDIKVCIMEAGKKDTDPRIHIPIGFAFFGPNNPVSWNYETVPQKEFEDVTVAEPTTEVVDTAVGVHSLKQEVKETFDDEFHGQEGPLNVSKIRHENKPTKDFVEAGSKIYKYNEDFNGAVQEGIGFYQTTQKDGKRCSTAKAYLVPALERPNLTVITEANVNKILIDNHKASGVEYIDAEGVSHIVSASKEVLLCSGAFGSPQILLRSGIGPREEIEKHGIEHKVDLPGVGKNLQDHIDYLTVHKYNSMQFIGTSIKAFLIKYPLEVLKYILKKTGLFTSTIAEAGGFIKSSESKEIPDIQLHFAPAMVVDHGRTQIWGHGFSCHSCLLRPKSRGTVTLKSADPLEDPLIDPKFLSHPDDMKDMIAGYKKMMGILNMEPVNKYIKQNCQRPVDLNDDADIEKAIRESADTVYHPVGTCKMGNDDMAVVDQRLKVHKLEGLRVVDASIMPTLIGGNTNAPTVMIGEKASDMIIADWKNNL